MLVEEEIGLGRVGVDARFALQKAEGDERVEEVARGARDAGRGGRLSSARGWGCLASSVKTCISTALSRVLEAQKPMPTCMMWSGRRSFMATFILD